MYYVVMRMSDSCYDLDKDCKKNIVCCVVGFAHAKNEVKNDNSVQFVVEDDNYYEFQQYVLSCTREWTALGYKWCTLDDAENLIYIGSDTFE